MDRFFIDQLQNRCMHYSSLLLISVVMFMFVVDHYAWYYFCFCCIA